MAPQRCSAPGLAPLPSALGGADVVGVAIGQASQDNQGVNLGNALGYALADFALFACVVLVVLLLNLRGHYQDHA